MSALQDQLVRLDRSIRDNPDWVAVGCALLFGVVTLAQDLLGSHLWLCVSYAVPVGLSAYVHGPISGLFAAAVATLFLTQHAIEFGTGEAGTLLIVLTRGITNVAIVALCSAAAAALRARDRYLEKERELWRLQADMVAALAHDVRSPANAILGYVEMLAEGAGQSGDRAGTAPAVAVDEEVAPLQRIRMNARQIDQLVCEMLAAQFGRGVIEVRSTRFTVKTLIDRIEAEMPPKGEFRGIEWCVAGGTPDFCTDRERLVAIVRNLVGNARKYSKGGIVRVRIEGKPELRGHQIVVSDDGAGIPESALESIFERFRRVGAEPGREGFGLGLFIVKQFATMLGGSVEVDGGEGRGAEFRVRIPRLEAPAVDALSASLR
jgi:signal transduction histidine kinase